MYTTTIAIRSCRPTRPHPDRDDTRTSSAAAGMSRLRRCYICQQLSSGGGLAPCRRRYAIRCSLYVGVRVCDAKPHTGRVHGGLLYTRNGEHNTQGGCDDGVAGGAKGFKLVSEKMRTRYRARALAVPSSCVCVCGTYI